jgi:transcriptional regulator with XRE-family HTH domain
MKDPKRKMTILCNHLKIDIKKLAKASGVYYGSLIAANLGKTQPAPNTLRLINEYIEKVKPGFKLNPFFFDGDFTEEPFVEKEKKSAVEQPIKIKIDNTKSINQRFVEVRRKFGLSQGDFAKKLDCIKGTLQSIEYNRMVPNIDLLRKLKHGGFIGSYEEFLDGVKTSEQEKIDELNHEIHLRDLKIQELEEDIKLWKSVVKMKSPK